jgi:hypothetical protein
MQFVTITELFRPPSLTSQPRPIPPQVPRRDMQMRCYPPPFIRAASRPHSRPAFQNEVFSRTLSLTRRTPTSPLAPDLAKKRSNSPIACSYNIHGLCVTSHRSRNRINCALLHFQTVSDAVLPQKQNSYLPPQGSRLDERTRSPVRTYRGFRDRVPRTVRPYRGNERGTFHRPPSFPWSTRWKVVGLPHLGRK